MLNTFTEKNMTKINRLTQIPEAQDNDIIPIWDHSANRTRGVLASTLKEYASGNEIVDAEINDNHLILIKKDGEEIDAGELPLISGIRVLDSGIDKGEFASLNFNDGFEIITNDDEVTINSESVPFSFSSYDEMRSYFSENPEELKYKMPIVVSLDESDQAGDTVKDEVSLVQWVGEDSPSAFDENLMVTASIVTSVSSLSLGGAHKISSGGQNVLTINKVTGSAFTPPWSEVGNHSTDEGRYVKDRPTSREHGDLLYIEPEGERSNSGGVDYNVFGTASSNSSLFGIKTVSAEEYNGVINYIIRSEYGGIVFNQSLNVDVKPGDDIDFWFDFPVDSLIGDVGSVSIKKTDDSFFKVRPALDSQAPYRQIKIREFTIKELAYKSEIKDNCIESIVAGNNITVDNTNPAKPIISTTSDLSDGELSWNFVQLSTPVQTGTYELSQIIDGNKVYAGVNDLLTIDYGTTTRYSYTIQLGMIKEFVDKLDSAYIILNTGLFYENINGQDVYTATVTESASVNRLAFSVNAPNPPVSSEGFREKLSLFIRGDEYSIKEEDISKDIIIQSQPYKLDSYGQYSLTLNFPPIDWFKRQYYIPTLNEDMKEKLPHIENLNIQCWINPEESRKGVEHRIYLRSAGDSITWGTSTEVGDVIGAFIRRAPDDESLNTPTSFNFMKLPEDVGVIGNMGGYIAQSSKYNTVYSLDTVPSDDLSNVISVDVDGELLSDKVKTLDFDSEYLEVKDSGENKVSVAIKAPDVPTFVGVFKSEEDLNNKYPNPASGLNANVLVDDGKKPDLRFESKDGSWNFYNPVVGSVIVDGQVSSEISIGSGLESTIDLDGTTIISSSGNTPVNDLDVTLDSSVSIGKSSVGRIISIIQTPPEISIPMLITLDDHSNFYTGDTIKIQADRGGSYPYKNYYFAVYYNSSTGAQRASYPSDTITLTRTETDWNIEQGGVFTNVSIRPKVDFNEPYLAGEAHNTPVNAFVFSESPAISFNVDQESDTRIVKIDLDKSVPNNPRFESLNIDAFNVDNEDFTTVISQDEEFRTVIDATRELRIKHKNISTGDTTTVVGIDNSQAQFLVPIFQGVDPVALKKDLPLIPENGYVEKFTNAETERVQIAYEGKYGDSRNYYPIEIKQDVNGWTQFEFTTNMLFKTKNKDTGVVGDKVFEVKQNGVTAHKKLEALKGHKVIGEFSVYDGDGNLACLFNHPESLFSVLYPTEISEQLTLSKSSGTVLQINRGAIKFWSSGAIELPNYTNFKDKELVTREYVDSVISGYSGQGVGVPEGEHVTAGAKFQTQPVGLYYNALNDASSRGDIQLSNNDGYNEFEVIIKGLNKPTRDWRITTGGQGRYSDKTIRIGETWQCRAIVNWEDPTQTQFFWTRLDDGTSNYVEEEVLNAKSGYNRLISGGGSTHTITYSENGSILKISNPTVKVQLLQGMSDDIPHGYIKYINSRNSDVQFEWYNRNGDQVTNNVPSVCPANTVVEIFADYSKDEYVLSFGQSKVINSINEEDQLMEGLAQGFIYAKSVSVG